MDKFSMFGRIRTPEKWKTAALEHRRNSRVRLNRWQSMAAIAVTAVVVGVMLIAPALIIKSHREIPDVVPNTDSDEGKIVPSGVTQDEDLDLASLPLTEEKVEGGSLSASQSEGIIKYMNKRNKFVMRAIVLDSCEREGHSYILIAPLVSYNHYDKGQSREFELSADGVDYTGMRTRRDLTGNIDKDMGDEVVIAFDQDEVEQPLPIQGYLNMGKTTNTDYLSIEESCTVLSRAADVDAKELILNSYSGVNSQVSSESGKAYNDSEYPDDNDILVEGLRIVDMGLDNEYSTAAIIKLTSRSGRTVTPVLEFRSAEFDKSGSQKEHKYDLDLGCARGTISVTTDEIFCRMDDIRVVSSDDPGTAYLVILCGHDGQLDEMLEKKDLGSLDVNILSEVTTTDMDGNTAKYWLSFVSWGSSGMGLSETLSPEEVVFDGEIDGFEFDIANITKYRSLNLYGQRLYTGSYETSLSISHSDGSHMVFKDGDTAESLYESEIYDTCFNEIFRIKSDNYDEGYVDLSEFTDYTNNRKLIFNIRFDDDVDVRYPSFGGWSLDGDYTELTMNMNWTANADYLPVIEIWEADFDTDYTDMEFTGPEDLDDPDSKFYCPNKMTITFSGADKVSEVVMDEDGVITTYTYDDVTGNN